MNQNSFSIFLNTLGRYKRILEDLMKIYSIVTLVGILLDFSAQAYDVVSCAQADLNNTSIAVLRVMPAADGYSYLFYTYYKLAHSPLPNPQPIDRISVNGQPTLNFFSPDRKFRIFSNNGGFDVEDFQNGALFSFAKSDCTINESLNAL